MFTVAFAVLGLAADPTPHEEKLLAKGDGFFVHAVRSGPLTRGQFGESSYGRDVFDRPGRYVLTHFNTATGKLTRLHAGGQWGSLVAGGVDRDFVYRQYIWGVAVDEQHLYVLLGRTLEVTAYFGLGAGRVTVTPTTVVQVFRLKDAELVQEVALPKALHTVDEKLTYDKLDRIPLAATKTELVVGDEKKPRARFRFSDQRTLIPEPMAEKKGSLRLLGT